jgi:hypothetical protein
MSRRAKNPFDGVSTAEELSAALKKHAGQLSVAQMRAAVLLARLNGWDKTPTPPEAKQDAEIGEPAPSSNDDVWTYSERDTQRTEALSYVSRVRQALGGRRVTLDEVLSFDAGSYDHKKWNEPERRENLEAVIRWQEFEKVRPDVTGIRPDTGLQTLEQRHRGDSIRPA